jgi:transcriptional regulator with XRE-family HTH domain
MPAPMPHTPADALKAAHLLATVIGNGFPTQRELAQHLGVAESGISQWMRGDRGIVPTVALLAAFAAAAARRPDRVPLLVETFAREVLGVHGTWVTSGARPGASVAVEMLDVHDRLAGLRARYAAAVSDERIDDGERREVTDAIAEVRRELEQLEATITHDLAARGGR